jgi:hypothetical protein
MNELATLDTPAITKPAVHLLDAIKAFKSSVGDDLNDAELTRLLLRTAALPPEAGFEFVSYCDRNITFSVPKQDLTNWYPDTGWISQPKEKAAQAIAKKYELTLCQPPDAQYVCLDCPNPHHHFEFSNKRETIILVHPLYMKVRLFLIMDSTRSAKAALRSLPLCPNLLCDLSALYQA